MDREELPTADHTGDALAHDQDSHQNKRSKDSGAVAGVDRTDTASAHLTRGAQRIILLLDGTWNDAEFDTHDTNIVRLREIISRSLTKRWTPLKAGAGAGPEEAGKASVGHTGPDAGGVKHLVYYLRGVGTGAGLDRLTGGGLGDGLEQNVRRAYKFLSFHYAPGDEVFVFGFSRGAYTARSLVGFIASAGLLKREHCSPEREQQAWSYYRSPPDDRYPGIWHALGPFMHEREEGESKMRIDCLGVFDTVGALGVPLTLLRRRNRQRYQFHNVELPSITKRNFHALAIDEHRRPFQAAVWRDHKFKRVDPTATEQVWFAGDHCDIGGGHFDAAARSASNTPMLDDLALDWMLKRVTHHFEAFPFDPSVWKDVEAAATHAPQHDLRRGQYLLWARNQRSIASQRIPLARSEFVRREVNESYDRYETPAAEMVHVSALERLGRRVSCHGQTSAYTPPALVATLRMIEDTYCGKDSALQFQPSIRVADWTGEPFSPEIDGHCRRVSALVRDAQERLGIAT